MVLLLHPLKSLREYFFLMALSLVLRNLHNHMKRDFRKLDQRIYFMVYIKPQFQFKHSLFRLMHLDLYCNHHKDLNLLKFIQVGILQQMAIDFEFKD